MALGFLYICNTCRGICLNRYLNITTPQKINGKRNRFSVFVCHSVKSNAPGRAWSDQGNTQLCSLRNSPATAETSAICFLQKKLGLPTSLPTFPIPSLRPGNVDEMASDVNLNAKIHCRKNLVIHVPVLLQSRKSRFLLSLLCARWSSCSRS